MFALRDKIIRLAYQKPELRNDLLPILKYGDGAPGGLTDPSHLRYQAVFLMGTAGSGKSYVAENRYLKYMPGAGEGGAKERAVLEKMLERTLDENERGLTNLNFENAVENLQRRGFDIELVDLTDARIPFRITEYTDEGKAVPIPRSEWEERLDPDVYEEVKNVQEIIFNSPVHELPSYWRQVNPDVYKEQLPGNRGDDPSKTHEMSSDMDKAYFAAVLEGGDPVVVDGTGRNMRKMTKRLEMANESGYQTSLVYIWVPLTVALIRNATRNRNVPPFLLEEMSKTIPKNYAKLRGLADVTKFVDNTNTSYDRKEWNKHAERIDRFMIKETGYNLYDFILKYRTNQTNLDTIKRLGVEPVIPSKK